MNENLEHAYQVRGRRLLEINEVSPWHAVYRKFLSKKIADWIGTEPMTVLDLCSGPGFFVDALLKSGHKVVCVDRLDFMLEIIEERTGAKHRHNLTLIECDASELSDIGLEFDAVLCTQALNFIKDVGPVLHAVHDVLKSNGRFLFDCDTAYRWIVLEALSGNLANAHHIAIDRKDKERNIVGADYYFHEPSSIRELLRGNFTVVGEFGHQFATPFIHAYAESQDFLDAVTLDLRARKFLSKDLIQKLVTLEELLAETLPKEIGAWYFFDCVKES